MQNLVITSHGKSNNESQKITFSSLLRLSEAACVQQYALNYRTTWARIDLRREHDVYFNFEP